MGRAKLLLIFSLAIFPLTGKAATLTFGDKKWDVAIRLSEYTQGLYVHSDFALSDLVASSLFGTSLIRNQQLFDDKTIKSLESLTTDINQPAQNAKLVIKDNKATTFDPGQNGQAIDFYALSKILKSEALEIPVPVILASPAVKLSDTNELGINELVAVGESDFKGSPHNRIFNIKVGIAKFDGLIIAPKEEFSFNKYLGAVDGEHGFLPELVIKPEGVTPEFGGGLCQVSSTAFRAAMNAGFPVTARRNHSFPVSYYAPQGTDATIYPGSSDLKFIVDLDKPILIHTKIIGTKLFFEYYGTKDTREVAFEGPVQYDKKPDGSMKATWTRHVTNSGQTVTQVFKSNYLSPALFHHDTVVPPAIPVITQ